MVTASDCTTSTAMRPAIPPGVGAAGEAFTLISSSMLWVPAGRGPVGRACDGWAACTHIHQCSDAHTTCSTRVARAGTFVGVHMMAIATTNGAVRVRHRRVRGVHAKGCSTTSK